MPGDNIIALPLPNRQANAGTHYQVCRTQTKRCGVITMSSDASKLKPESSAKHLSTPTPSFDVLDLLSLPTNTDSKPPTTDTSKPTTELTKTTPADTSKPTAETKKTEETLSFDNDIYKSDSKPRTIEPAPLPSDRRTVAEEMHKREESFFSSPITAISDRSRHLAKLPHDLHVPVLDKATHLLEQGKHHGHSKVAEQAQKFDHGHVPGVGHVIDKAKHLFEQGKHGHSPTKVPHKLEHGLHNLFGKGLPNQIERNLHKLHIGSGLFHAVGDLGKHGRSRH